MTVAIVSWNTRELLARCLRSLEPDADTGLAEVWVADNGSTDGSAELVRDEFTWAHLIALDENVGFGGAVNLVAGQTESPWLAPCNADVAVRPGALAELVAASRTHPDAGAIAPQLVLPDGSPQHSVYSFPTLPFTLLFNVGAYHVVPGLGDRLCLEGRWNPERPRTVDWAIGAFLLVGRAAWDAAGGFDQGQWMYAEDLDLGWRLHESGWSTRYHPAATVDHAEGSSARQVWGEQRRLQWTRSTYAWMLRRRGALLTRTVALVNIAGAGLRWIAFGAMAAVRPDPWAYRRDAMRGWMRAHAIGLDRAAALRAHR